MLVNISRVNDEAINEHVVLQSDFRYILIIVSVVHLCNYYLVIFGNNNITRWQIKMIIASLLIESEFILFAGGVRPLGK